LQRPDSIFFLPPHNTVQIPFRLQIPLPGRNLYPAWQTYKVCHAALVSGKTL
jgi:hypothetical protein